MGRAGTIMPFLPPNVKEASTMSARKTARLGAVIAAGALALSACGATANNDAAAETNGNAAGLGPDATGIAAFILSAWSGATCLRSRGGGAGGAACAAGFPEVELATPAMAANPISPSTPAPIVSRG